MKTLLFSMLTRIQFELVKGSEDIQPKTRLVLYTMWMPELFR